MARKQRIFTRRKRRVYRKTIPRGEMLVGVSLLAVLFLFRGWFISRAADFDPSERDISIEVLQESAVEDRLYKAPLVRWMEPGDGPVGASAPAIRLGVFPPSVLDGEWTPSSRI